MSYQDPDPSQRSDRRLFIGLGVTALAVVIAAVVVIVLVSNSHSQSSDTSHLRALGTATTVTATVTAPHIVNSTATAAATTPAGSGTLEPDGGPVPEGFEPESFTAVSDDVWWVLGGASCGSPPCTSIVRSADGGKSFVGIPAPRTDRVTNLRFADARDGYAYGTQLWSTHDGGATWTQVTSVPGTVESLATSDGDVYAAASQGLYRSPVGRDDWTQVHSGDVQTVWAQGDEVLADVTSAGGTGTLLSSADGGGTFVSHAAPAGTLACSFTTTGDGVIWAPCATGTQSNVWRSTDGGAHWTTSGLGKVQGEVPAPEPNSAPFAEADAEIAVFGAYPLYRTTDGGASFAAVPGFTPSSNVVYLGFTDPIHGVAIVDTNGGQASSSKLEVTADGGASYSPVTIAPG